MACVPASHMETRVERLPATFEPCPALVMTCIWAVSQQVEALSLSLSVSTKILKSFRSICVGEAHVTRE